MQTGEELSEIRLRSATTAPTNPAMQIRVLRDRLMPSSSYS